MAAFSNSSSVHRSTIPQAMAVAASTGLPPVIMSSAFSAPISRGSRWVPPDPGNRPSLTSGRPSFASLTATR